MTRLPTPIAVGLALLAFAGNSLLCRAALRDTAIDPASFTTIRLVSGSALLGLLAWMNHDRTPSGSGHGPDSTPTPPAGNWRSALALWIYAASLSWAYIGLATGLGALLLFGAVQVTMIGTAGFRGDRLRGRQWVGLILALVGLTALLSPNTSHAPPLVSSLLMLMSGVAWGVYSLLGRGAVNPIAVTAGNFRRAAMPALALSAVMWSNMSVDRTGAIYATASGALTSGVGYALWYTVLPRLSATTAAVLQLCAPVLATFGGLLMLGEPVGLRLALAGLAVLGGVALVSLPRRRSA